MAGISAERINISLIHFCLAIGTTITLTIYVANISSDTAYIKRARDEDRAAYEKNQQANDLRMQKLEVDMADLRVRVGILESRYQKMQDEK